MGSMHLAKRSNFFGHLGDLLRNYSKIPSMALPGLADIFASPGRRCVGDLFFQAVGATPTQCRPGDT